MNIDSSVIQFSPKGGYYNTENEQLMKMEELWDEFFKFDRAIFALSTLLPGTAFSKGRMHHLLLSNPIPNDQALVSLKDVNLDTDFEKRLILYNLRNESIPRSLKTLLFMLGIEKDGKMMLQKVNNSKTRKIILSYIYDRDDSSLDGLVVKYKDKIRTLTRHALGKQNLYNLLNGDRKVFNKYFRFSIDVCSTIDYDSRLEILKFVFNKPTDSRKMKEFRQVLSYLELRDAANSNNKKKFLKVSKDSKLPIEVLIGFRNQSKLDVDLKNLYKTGKMSERQAVQSKSAAKRAGVDIKVDYSKQDLYDLWKVLYHDLTNEQFKDFDEIANTIIKKSEQKSTISFGKCVVIFDCSESMIGSDKRPLHPFLTGLSLISTLADIERVIYVGGVFIQTPSKIIPNIIYPKGGTKIYEALIEAAKSEPETVVIISDGYENIIEGSTEAVYNYIKQNYNFKVVQLNPVFSAENEGVKKIIEDQPVLSLTDHKYLETDFVFNLLMTHKEQVKQLLVNKYKTLILNEKNKSTDIGGYIK